MQRGFNAKSVDLEDYEPEELGEEEAPVVFLMATHGEGEPTDNAVQWYKYFNDATRQPDELRRLKCATFALGNRQYEHFCYMGRWIDEKMVSLGASRIFELGEGDDDDNMDADFETWRAGLWEALCPGGGDVTEAPAPQFESKMLPGGKPPSTLAYLGSALPKQQLFECRVLVNRELAQRPEQGSVRHIELAVDTGSRVLRYNTADDLAVCPDNGVALATRVAKSLGLDGAQRFALRALHGALGSAPPLPTPCSVEQALRFFADLRAPVGKAMLVLLAEHASAPAEAERLRHLASAEGKQEYAEYVQRAGRGLAELLDDFQSTRPPWALLLELTPKLSPRYYTISSSPAHAPDAVHITVKVLREPMRGAQERTKLGVCSTHLERLGPGASAVVFVRSSGFVLPRAPATPLIMVGPGTGVAPFRAFLQQLRARANGDGGARGHVRLYFGCRRSDTDYLYKEELEGYLADGTLGCLRTAFSREQQHKVYVQHRIAQDGAELWALLARGAHFYVCGGTSMGRDVVAALQAAVAEHGSLSEEAAAAYLKQMQAQGRMVQELWS